MKMKKFINAPETITDEELVGLGLAYPDILTVDGHLVISKDLENADRVTIVTYGGSGHEPAQAGFVGKGMLDVQAVGDIFAAPNAKLVFEAMKRADKGHGVLLLTLNYAGDQLAGKQAIKLAQKAGLNFRQVITGEEIQYDPNGEDNRRGLAGAVALYHIAAAAAREGRSLDEVAEIAQHYADNMASITVKSTDATHPQNGMPFGDLGETDMMEIGAGQHGEGGGVRVPMMSSKDTVATVAEALSSKLGLAAGDKAFVMINACAAVTAAEQELSDIDARFGDADHGLTMSKIAGAISGALEEPADGIQEMLDGAAMAVMEINGGSAVPLWNTWLDGMQENAPAGGEIDAAGLKAMFAGAYEALADISGAKVGDKTMMDALIPATEAIAAYDGADEAGLLAAAAAAAAAGAENSRNFVSKFGRAKSYGEQTIGTPDAGAVSMAYFFRGLAE